LQIFPDKAWPPISQPGFFANQVETIFPLPAMPPGKAASMIARLIAIAKLPLPCEFKSPSARHFDPATGIKTNGVIC